MVVAPTMIVPAVSAAHSEAEQVPAQSCGKGYTYTKIDDTRWKCLTDEDADKVAADHDRDSAAGVGVVFVILVVVALVCVIFISTI